MNRIPPLTAIDYKQFSSRRLQQSFLGIVEFGDQQSTQPACCTLPESCVCVGLSSGEVCKGDMMARPVMAQHILRKYANTYPEIFSSCCFVVCSIHDKKGLERSKNH